ncbi:MAG: gliding motility-associated C-terminal domain-containing protein, partial [Bacteroidia bacterium]
GGAGGGGTVVINTMGMINLTAATAISANGGSGGNASIYGFCATNEAYGPGGGGGGGYVALSAAGATSSVNGGVNGVVNGTNSSLIKTNFPPNGATKGGDGTSGTGSGVISNFSVSAAPQTICAGNTATLTSSTSGTVPGGITINWYSASTGGAPLASGTTFTTPVLASTTVYYVGTCPGTYRDSVKVTVNPAPAAPTASSPVNYCQNAAASALSATASGGNTLSWWGTSSSGGISSATAPTPSTATVGSTIYYVSQNNGSCDGARTPITVNINAVPVAPTATSPVNYCQNDVAVPLSATPAGGNTLNWWGTSSSGGVSSGTAPTPSTASTGSTIYYVSQTNGSCDGPRTPITVTVNALPLAPTAASPVNYCQNDAAVPLSATPAGGNTLNWWGTSSSGGVSSGTAPTPSTATVGSTTYYVSQTNGTCDGTRTPITVTINALPLAPTAASPVNYCQNDVAVPLSATPAGGNTLNWWGTSSSGGTSSATAPTPSTTAVGSTTYYVSQSNGTCEGPRTAITVTVNALPVAPSATSPVSYCQNDAAVPLSATPAGGNTLNWWGTSSSGGVSSGTAPTPSTASAGSTIYYVSQTNGSCDGPRTPITVNVNSIPATPIPTSNSPVCTGQTINLFANVAGVTYAWSGPGAFSSTIQDPTITNAGAAEAGTYSLTVNDGNCTSLQGTVSVTTTSTSNPAITAVSPFCQNDAPITLSAATGGGTWSGNGITDANLGTFDPSTALAGTDTITYTLSGSCGGMDTVVISVTPNANASITNAPAALCLSGSPFNLTTAQSGGTWTGTGVNAAGTFDPAVAGLGTWQLIYTINGSCGDADTVDIVVSSTADATINPVAAMCQNNGAITLTAAQGGGTWSGSGITDANLGTFDPATAIAGTDTITYTISGSCGAMDTLVVSITPNANASITNAPASLCLNASPVNLTTAQAGGIWTGTGVNAGGTFDPSLAGTGNAQLIYTISGSCGDADTVYIAVNASPDPTINTVAPMCQNAGTITLSAAQGGGTWSGSGITDANLGTFDPSLANAGTDTITYTVAGACGAMDTVVITVNALADATITNPPSTLCTGNPATTLTATQAGGTWTGTGITNGSTGTFDPGISGTGNFQVIYTITGSCGDADTISISVSPLIASTINPGGPFCSNASSTTLSAANTGGTWSGNGITNTANGTFDPATAGVGNQTITYTISGTCGSTSSAIITVNASADATISNAPATLCSNAGAVSLTTAQAGGTWTGTGVNSSGVFDPAIAGNGAHQLIYTISGACGDADTVMITVNNSSGLSFNNLSVVCRTETVTFNTTSASSCNTLSWNFGDGNTGSGSNPSNTYDSAGVYTVTAVCTTLQGCVDSFKVNNAVTVNPLPDPYFTIDLYVVGVNEPVTYTSLSPSGNSIHWDFGDPASGLADSSNSNPVSHSYSTTGLYCTKLELNSVTTGCYNYSTGCIEVAADGTVVIPNIFTPNGDNLNDLFTFKTTSVKSLSCSIFDRWGLKMYDWDGINGAWDGKAKSGNRAPDGVYYYLVKYTDTKGDSREVKGFVTLIN